MQVDLKKTQAASFIKGLGKTARVSGVLNIPSFGLGGSSTSGVFSTTIPFAQSDAAFMSMIKISGLTNALAANKWIVLNGGMFIRDGTSLPDMLITVERGSGNIKLSAQVQNTAVSGITVPAMTIQYEGLAFTPPW